MVTAGSGRLRVFFKSIANLAVYRGRYRPPKDSPPMERTQQRKQISCKIESLLFERTSMRLCDQRIQYPIVVAGDMILKRVLLEGTAIYPNSLQGEKDVTQFSYVAGASH